MVHQHFMLVPVMTVAENIVLATEPRTAGVFLDYDAAIERVRDLAATFRFAIDPDAKVENITVGQQQRVEILKALYRGADILILDEPTAVLTPQEADELFAILRNAHSARACRSSSSLTSSARCSRSPTAITVLRRGKKIDTVPRKVRPRRACAPDGRPRGSPQGREAAGRSRRDAADGREAAGGGRSWPPGRARRVVRRARAARSSALAGVDGNGQSELIDAITGLRKLERGTHPVGRP